MWQCVASRAVERMSEQGIFRVCKRVSIDLPAVRNSLSSESIIFSPSVEILKNGPTLRKATEITEFRKRICFYNYLIAAVDGLDLTVASIQSG